ncbi:MAG: hypothetical protein HYY37_04265 [Candidatus Aenigmarchaeota archaeon]|nr:hypothetical protein [Candidatus Aenigmarchaeota archaeon]
MKLRICPRCNSPKVSAESFLFFLSGMYLCQNCGYKSSLFPEIEVKNVMDVKKIRLKKMKKRPMRR